MTVLMSWMLNPKNRWSELGWSLTHRIFHFEIIQTLWYLDLKWWVLTFILSSFLPSLLSINHQYAYSYLDSIHLVLDIFGYFCYLMVYPSSAYSYLVLCFWFWIFLFRRVWNGLDGPAEHRSSNIIATFARGFKNMEPGERSFWADELWMSRCAYIFLVGAGSTWI